VPDKHNQHKSKYTIDRGMPGAFDGETVTRRRFMNIGGQTAGIIAAASFTLPALGFAVCLLLCAVAVVGALMVSQSTGSGIA